MSPCDRYQRTIEIYTSNIYHFPRKYIIGLKKIRPIDYLKELPAALAASDPLTVYRATSMNAQEVQNEISWTINKNVALWFYNRLHPAVRRLYEATINKDRIIAYISSDECEVLQHRGVVGVHEITCTESEIAIAVAEHRKQLEASGMNCG